MKARKEVPTFGSNYLNILHLSKQWTAISSSKYLCVPSPIAEPCEPSGQSGTPSTGSAKPGQRLRPGAPLGSLRLLPQAGAVEQKCKDGLSAVTGLEPAGTHSHPAPASSHIVMDEGQEPAPDLCPRGWAFPRALGSPGERGRSWLSPPATVLEPSRGPCQGHSVDILFLIFIRGYIY